jgi:hypothetical protein
LRHNQAGRLCAVVVGVVLLGVMTEGHEASAQISPQYRSHYRPSEVSQYTFAKYGQTALWWRHTTTNMISIDFESIRMKGSTDYSWQPPCSPGTPSGSNQIEWWNVRRVAARKRDPSDHSQWVYTVGPLSYPAYARETNCGLNDAGALRTISLQNIRSALEHQIQITFEIKPRDGSAFSASRAMRSISGGVQWLNPATGSWTTLPTSATAP